MHAAPFNSYNLFNPLTHALIKMERIDLTQFSEKVNDIRQAIAEVVVGQASAVDMLLAAMLADGHVLIEGVPGVAKTLLARLTAALVDAPFGRLQFTPDLMPSDVLGTSVFDVKQQDFVFHAGPVFKQVLLVDEVNRAPAKTQAALFEVMEERQATVDGVTHPMPELFTIIATQNPVEQEGTYKLPEAQLDRFLVKITMGYPSPDEEFEILRRHQQHNLRDLSAVKPVLTSRELLDMRTVLQQVVVDDEVLRYICRITDLTRHSRHVYLGASPRAAVALLQMAKAMALLQGRDFVTPDDVKNVAPAVLSHRIQLAAEAEMEGMSVPGLVNRLLEAAVVEN